LIDQLGLHYMHAHQIALRAEQAAVRSAGIIWRDYDQFMQQFIKEMGDERLRKVPADLDLKPYRDEHDVDLLERMLAERKDLPAGLDRKAIRQKLAHLKEEPISAGGSSEPAA